MGFNVDWSALRGLPSVGEQFNKGMAEGRDLYRQGVQDNALAGLARNPNDPDAMSRLAGVSPDAAWKFEDRRNAISKRERDEAAALLEANRDNILKGARIIREVNPTDQAGLDQALMMAQQIGIDISQVPREWNEQTRQYTQGLIAAADAFEPRKSDASDIQFLTPQDGGVYAGNKRTGKIDPVIIPTTDPNLAGKPASAPANGLPTVTDDAGFDALPPGAEFQDIKGNIRKKPGGPTQPGSGRFPA